MTELSGVLISIKSYGSDDCDDTFIVEPLAASGPSQVNKDIIESLWAIFAFEDNLLFELFLMRQLFAISSPQV